MNGWTFRCLATLLILAVACLLWAARPLTVRVTVPERNTIRITALIAPDARNYWLSVAGVSENWYRSTGYELFGDQDRLQHIIEWDRVPPEQVTVSVVILNRDGRQVAAASTAVFVN